MTPKALTRFRAAAVVEFYRRYARGRITRREYERAVETLWQTKGA